MSHHTPTSFCPKCDAVLDRAASTSDDNAAPKEGDLSICIECATPLIFDKDLLVKELTDEEKDKLDFMDKMMLEQTITMVRKFKQ